MKHATGTGKYERLLERCKNQPAVPTAVAHPCEESALRAAVQAAQLGLVEPILVGPKEEIEETAKAAGLSLETVEIIDAENSVAAAQKAVALIREGKAEILMKGSLHTDELMAAVVSRQDGLRTGRRSKSKAGANARRPCVFGASPRPRKRAKRAATRSVRC